MIYVLGTVVNSRKSAYYYFTVMLKTEEMLVSLIKFG